MKLLYPKWSEKCCFYRHVIDCDPCRNLSCCQTRFYRSSSPQWSSGSCWPSPCPESRTYEDFSPRKPTGTNTSKVTWHTSSLTSWCMNGPGIVSSHRSESDDPQGGRQLSWDNSDCSVVNNNFKPAATYCLCRHDNWEVLWQWDLLW